MQDDPNHAPTPSATAAGETTGTDAPAASPPTQSVPREIGGPSGPEPTRFGDWERKGRCIDF